MRASWLLRTVLAVIATGAPKVRRGEVERLADVIGGAVGAEGDGRIAARVVVASARHGRIVGEPGDARQEAVRQRGRPGLAAVEGGADCAAVVVVPVVGAGQHV